MPPRKAISRRPPTGSTPRCVLEVGDDAVHRQPRVVARPAPRRPRSSADGLDVHRHVRAPACRARAAPRAAAGSSPTSRSRARPACRAPVARGDLGGPGEQDLPLGPGRVVLRQPGDLLEQLAAALVVEPLRRQRLRGARSGPRVTSARSASARKSGGRWRLQGERLGQRVHGASGGTSSGSGVGVDPVGGGDEQRAVGDGDPAGLVVVRLGGDHDAVRRRPASTACRPRWWPRSRGRR